MAGKDRLKVHDPVTVRLLNSSPKSLVEITGVVAVAVAVRHDATVNRSGVAMPDIHVQGGYGFPRRRVNHLYV